jgi:rhodanese-related sulfurtransferase
MVIRQMFLLGLTAAVLSLLVNLVSPNKIPYVGKYYEFSVVEGAIVPPSAEKGDPPFIAIDRAQAEFGLGQALFVDARDVEEFNCGTIPGAVSLPFEELPEDNLAGYVDSVLGGVAKDHPIITFCGGEECDLSLQLARNLQSLGYSNILIFFGGAREWEDKGLTMERRVKCDG